MSTLKLSFANTYEGAKELEGSKQKPVLVWSWFEPTKSEGLKSSVLNHANVPFYHFWQCYGITYHIYYGYKIFKKSSSITILLNNVLSW